MKRIFSILVLAVGLFSGFLSQAQEPYNCDDPKCQQEKTRLSNPATMNAQFLSRGIPCDTGACFKDAAPDLGLDPTAFIVPPDGSKPTEPRVSPADVVQ